MAKKEVEVTFNTLTPLWTGDAWGECREIKPSSLIGSLRFWFEVICYFSGICSNDDFNKKSGRFEKEVNKEKLKKCLLKKGNSFESEVECLTEQDIPLPSIIFGTTNWRSLIEIKEVTPIEDYCFGNKLNLPYAIAFSKRKDLSDEAFDTRESWENKINTYEGRDFKEKLRKAQKDYSFFFFINPYFYGKFLIVFEVEENIIEAIFYPLLSFMDKYGFWGGKWNIGYGRLKVKEIPTKEFSTKNEFKLTDIFSKNPCKGSKIRNISIEPNKDIIEVVSTFSDLINFQPSKNNEMKLKLLENQVQKKSFLETIKDLIRKKSEERKNCNLDAEIRHKIFGTTEGPPTHKNLLPQGSKILPYIYKENKEFQGGFLSIAGLLNLKGESDG